jgi:hypothetical protein
MLLLKRVSKEYLGLNKEELEHAQFGVMIVEGYPIVTIERPWLPEPGYPAGKSMISCIPKGEYEIKKEYSTKYKKNMYYLENKELGVFAKQSPSNEKWHRTNCMFHVANWVGEINGCIAAGTRIEKKKGEYAISESTPAVARLYQYLDKQNGRLSIVIE